jgi:hypothetical protein
MTFVIDLSNESAGRSSPNSKICGTAMISPFNKAIDRQVERQFRKDPNGRLVFLPVGSRGKAYFVDLKSDEEKIRAFVKMYRNASVLIYWLWYLSFYIWLGTFNTNAHRWMTEVGIASSFCLLLLLSVWILWSLYKQTVPAFTISLVEVGPDLKSQLSDISAPPRRLQGLALAILFAGIIVLGVAVLLATRRFPGNSACPPKCTSTSPVSR